jgi:hypothetical protein
MDPNYAYLYRLLVPRLNLSKKVHSMLQRQGKKVSVE